MKSDIVWFAVAFGGSILVSAMLGLVLLEVFGTIDAPVPRPSSWPEDTAP